MVSHTRFDRLRIDPTAFFALFHSWLVSSFPASALSRLVAGLEKTRSVPTDLMDVEMTGSPPPRRSPETFHLTPLEKRITLYHDGF